LQAKYFKDEIIDILTNNAAKGESALTSIADIVGIEIIADRVGIEISVKNSVKVKQQIKRFRWFRGSVLPLSTQVRGFKPS
jgi:hypothetical protein